MKKDLNISCAIAEPGTVVSRLVNFSLSSKHRTNQLEVKNVWVVDTLNFPRQKDAPNDIKNAGPTLKIYSLKHPTNKISVLVGANLNQLHRSYDVRVGENDHPVGMLTKLGWVLLGGKADKGKTNVTLNHVKTDGLQKLVQKFWEIESYATLPKNDIKLLPKKDAHAMKILQTTTSKVQNRYSVGLLWKEQLPELPNNRCLAISRMLSLEKKFEKSPH